MKKILLSATVLLAMISAPAFADHDSGYYAGVKLGNAHAGFGNGDLGTTGADKNQWAAGGLVGYQFDKTWAVEASWDYLGKFDYRGGDVRADYLSVAGVGKYDLCEKAHVYGKLGLGTGYTKVNADGVPANGNRNVGTVFGAGIGYDIDHNYEVRGEWTRYDNVGVKNGDIGQGHIDLVSVSGVYHF